MAKYEKLIAGFCAATGGMSYLHAKMEFVDAAARYYRLLALSVVDATPADRIDESREAFRAALARYEERGAAVCSLATLGAPTAMDDDVVDALAASIVRSAVADRTTEWPSIFELPIDEIGPFGAWLAKWGCTVPGLNRYYPWDYVEWKAKRPPLDETDFR